MAMTTEYMESIEKKSSRYMFIGLVIGLVFMGLNVYSLGVETSVPLLLLISFGALISTFGIQAGAAKLGTITIGVWFGTIIVFAGAFMLEMFSAIGYCQYSSPIPLEFIVC